MARIDFINQLQALGFEPQELPNGMVEITYSIIIGKNAGHTLKLAFQIPNDFPMNCPTGPHFKSVGIDGWLEPSTNIHSSPMGSEWRYWSRPFPDWNRTLKSVKVYLAHIKNLLTRI